MWSAWRDALVLVKPDTVVRRHRAGFKLYWSWISQLGRRTGRPAVSAELRDLIRKMATENGWGAPRIHGELKMLGLDISERTVSRYLRGLRRRPEARPSWLTFLRNQPAPRIGRPGRTGPRNAGAPVHGVICSIT
jgi:hypothetical protein